MYTVLVTVLVYIYIVQKNKIWTALQDKEVLFVWSNPVTAIKLWVKTGVCSIQRLATHFSWLSTLQLYIIHCQCQQLLPVSQRTHACKNICLLYDNGYCFSVLAGPRGSFHRSVWVFCRKSQSKHSSNPPTPNLYDKTWLQRTSPSI